MVQTRKLRSPWRVDSCQYVTLVRRLLLARYLITLLLCKLVSCTNELSSPQETGTVAEDQNINYSQVISELLGERGTKEVH